jgi:hypothetical protein
VDEVGSIVVLGSRLSCSEFVTSNLVSSLRCSFSLIGMVDIDAGGWIIMDW